MKKKLMAKAVAAVPPVVSAVLLCLSVWGFSANGGIMLDAYAQGTDILEKRSTETGENQKSPEESGTGAAGEKQENVETDGPDKDAEKHRPAEKETGDSGKTGPAEDETKADAESGSSASGSISASICACQDKCTQYSHDTGCSVCADDYARCTYKKPNVKITIKTPEGWHSDSAKVRISVKDTVKSGNFTVQSIQAKTAQNGSWTDITEDKYVEISEDSTVYVLVTDQYGRTYEKSRHIRCFDFTKPVINAAVSDGLLSIRAYDTDSGIRAVYVNGYEFVEPAGGALNIRLQQFDAGYQYFTMQALDYAGNMSEVYKTANPYYTDPETEPGGEGSPAEQLPASARAAAPASATAQVTRHTVTDSSGNTVAETDAAADNSTGKKKAATASGSGKAENESTDSAVQDDKGKEFYTIQTAGEKVFYLVIDKNGGSEEVYFLTEISENDLLNVTADNSQTLPKNSAVLESALPSAGNGLPDSGLGDAGINQGDSVQEAGTADDAQDAEKTGEDEPEQDELEENVEEKDSPAAAYLILAVLAAGILGGGYYLKSVRAKKEAFLDEEDDDEEEYEDDEEKDEDAGYGDSGDEDFPYAGENEE